MARCAGSKSDLQTSLRWHAYGSSSPPTRSFPYPFLPLSSLFPSSLPPSPPPALFVSTSPTYPTPPVSNAPTHPYLIRPPLPRNPLSRTHAPPRFPHPPGFSTSRTTVSSGTLSAAAEVGRRASGEERRGGERDGEGGPGRSRGSGKGVRVAASTVSLLAMPYVRHHVLCTEKGSIRPITFLDRYPFVVWDISITCYVHPPFWIPRPLSSQPRITLALTSYIPHASARYRTFLPRRYSTPCVTSRYRRKKSSAKSSKARYSAPRRYAAAMPETQASSCMF